MDPSHTVQILLSVQEYDGSHYGHTIQSPADRICSACILQHFQGLPFQYLKHEITSYKTTENNGWFGWLLLCCCALFCTMLPFGGGTITTSP